MCLRNILFVGIILVLCVAFAGCGRWENIRVSEVSVPSSMTESSPLITAASVPSGSAETEPGAPAAQLKALDVWVTSGGGGQLEPAFSGDILDYTIHVDSDIAHIKMIPTAQDSTDLITFPGEENNGENAIESDLQTGSNFFSITVQDTNGNTSVYQIDVERKDSQPMLDSFLPLTFEDVKTGFSMSYRLYIPADYDAGKSYPIVLFLHGYGEIGSNNSSQILASQGAAIWASPQDQQDHPCFVLAPQSTMTGWTSIASYGLDDPYEPQADLELAYKMLQSVISEYSIDTTRVYGTGSSMGGYGIWAMAIEHPNLFAAIVPVCGDADQSTVSILKDLPVWIFQADSDPTIPSSLAKDLVPFLQNLGSSPRFTLYDADTYFYPSAHYSWVPAYADEDMRAWLFEQSR